MRSFYDGQVMIQQAQEQLAKGQLAACAATLDALADGYGTFNAVGLDADRAKIETDRLAAKAVREAPPEEPEA